MGFFEGFFAMLTLVFILFGAYITSRWFAMRQNDMLRGKYINIVDRIILGKDKSVIIMQIGQKVFLMLETAQGFTNISELNETDLIPIKHQQIQNSSFQDVLSKYLGVELPNKTETYENTLNALTDLKNRASSSLNRMINRNKGKENTDEEQ